MINYSICIKQDNKLVPIYENRKSSKKEYFNLRNTLKNREDLYYFVSYKSK